MSRFDIGWGDVAMGLTASAVLCVGGLVIVGIVLVRLPQTYFVGEAPSKPLWADKPPAVRWTGRILKNVAGLIAVAAGLALALPTIPGPGLLVVLGGLGLLDFPGKRRLEKWLIRRPMVHRTANRIRKRHGKPPLVLEEEGEEEGL